MITLLYFLQEGCPACTERAQPQARAVRDLFKAEDVSVSAVYPAGNEELWRRYSIQGTPSLILLDHTGRLRRRFTGAPPDLQLGAELMSLIRELS